MPRNLSMGIYLVRFTGPDGPHIARACSRRYSNGEEKRKVHAAIVRGLHPASPEYPGGNPDIRVDSIELVDSPMDIDQAVGALRKSNPERILIDQLGLDYPNRVLHDPQILRDIAAASIPG